MFFAISWTLWVYLFVVESVDLNTLKKVISKIIAIQIWKKNKSNSAVFLVIQKSNKTNSNITKTRKFKKTKQKRRDFVLSKKKVNLECSLL